MPALPSPPIDEVYKRLFPLIASKCRRMLGDSFEAQDVAQEAFTRFWEHRDALRDSLAVTSWLYRTSTRIAIDRLRRPRVGSFDDEPPAAGIRGEAQTAEDVSDARAMLKNLTMKLDPEELEVILLSRVDGLTHPEMADVLETSERTIRRRLARAEQRLESLTEPREVPR
jgi:RNA polymerase sigma-70 factor (ECF subfamily)